MADDATKKQTCLQCRKRKAPNDSAGINLPLNQAHAANSRQRTKYTIGGIERRRGLRACRPCRASKSRCSGGWPTCRNCEQRRLDCQYLPSKRRKIPLDPAPCPGNNTLNEPTLSNLRDLNGLESVPGVFDLTQSNSVKDINLASNKIFLESHVNAYFKYFHVIPQFNFLHKSSFLRDFHHDTLDPVTLCCVCGIASRFINQNADKSYVSRWLEEIEAQIWSRTGEMKIQNLQLIVLLVCWYSLERKISHMWTASALATRMAYGMRLNHETTDKLPFVLRESRRRLMWSIFMFDKMYAGGISELTLCTASTMHISLPCEGRNFDLDIPIETSVLEPANANAELEAGIGIMGHITRLMNIRHAILEMMISGIRESVPEPVQQEVPLSYAEQCRSICLHHAIKMCSLWSDTLREADLTRLTDQSIGIYAYQCANIIANLWELDHDDTLKVSLQTIVSILERPATIYPIVAEIDVGPSEGSVTGPDNVESHKEEFQALCKERGPMEEIMYTSIRNTGSRGIMMKLVDFHRNLDLSEARALGLNAELSTESSWYTAFDRVREAKLML
ncbi:hypothetical protein PENSUB_5629 [Penicillium subrubescens]|uniref:Zn(2)-C6 fungal-type domain-containing protein n=1 Tax=Penicillium subrubescens TaxID=1316194 RepID=A0A1Q5U710_9EURO|nr:hypothetical protein PENSUB_5629 [Penicillium subrubescens]